MRELLGAKVNEGLAITLGQFTRAINRPRVLTYHSIAPLRNSKLHVHPVHFEEQVRFLAERDFRGITISELVEGWPRIAESQKVIALTFDDGLLNNFTEAADILKRYSMKATFFVPTAYIHAERLSPVGDAMMDYDGLPMMCWEDLRKLVDNGFEIGSHSHSHVMIAKLKIEQGMDEIIRPKKILEKELGISIVSFAYPYGHSDSLGASTKEILRRSGYLAGCTMVSGFVSGTTDLYEIPRQSITGFDTLASFKMKLNGNYDCLRWFRPVK